MPGVAHLMINSKNNQRPKGENMRNPVLVNNFMHDAAAAKDSAMAPQSSNMGLLASLTQAQEVNGSADNHEDVASVRSSGNSQLAASVLPKTTSSTLLNNLKLGVSSPNNNKLKTTGKSNGFLAHLIATDAKISKEYSDDSTPSPSSKTFNSKKSRRPSLLGKGITPPSTCDVGRNVDYSESEVRDSDSEEEVTSLEPPVQPFWSTFEESILQINDKTNQMTLQPRPNFKSSDDFKDVMTDMFGNTEYGKARSYTLLKQKINRLANVSGMTSRLFSKVAVHAEDTEDEEDEETEEEAREKDMKTMVSELKGAKRGWKLIRRNVNETALAENTRESKLKWSMVRHHLTKMSDLDKARQDLYERYGIVPAVQEDGSMQCKNVMWSQRAVSMNMTNPSLYKLPSNSNFDSQKPKVHSDHIPRPASGPVRPKTCVTTSRQTKKVVSKSRRPASDTRVVR